jgi:hypothetical protein
MNDFLNNVKKHGALGVLAMWLWITHARVERLEEKLYDCYEQQNVSSLVTETHKQLNDIRLFAILPKELKYDIKRIRKQTTTS